MIEFIDKTDTQNGTLINRERLMGIQGYEKKTVVFDGDTIISTNKDGQVETTTFSGNQIIKTFTGEKTITVVTTFSENSYVSEVV